jgi:hypothetical protein
MDAMEATPRSTIAARAVGRLRTVRRRVASRGSARGRPIDAILVARSAIDAQPAQNLRIVVAAPPKTGNMWIKCLLASIYDLQWLPSASIPRDSSPEAFRELVEGGTFPRGSIFHRHYAYSSEFCRAAETASVHIVTIIRDPYDLFVSMYFHAQNFPDRAQRENRPLAAVIGKPLDHPDVLGYLGRDFGASLEMANGWIQSGRSILIRYEDLHRDPVAALMRATDRIRAVPRAVIERAIEACRADQMRQRMPKHVRAATVGDSKQRLGPEHLAVFRERHADLIRALGYEVR